jgi:hypothetical protein
MLAIFPLGRASRWHCKGSCSGSIADDYFHDVRCYEDREAAYPVLVYRVARAFQGRASTEFTYDLRDYPENRETLAASWKMTGQALRRVLAGVEQRLYLCGMPALARGYAPIWYEDMTVAVRKRPRRSVELLGVHQCSNRFRHAAEHCGGEPLCALRESISPGRMRHGFEKAGDGGAG